MEDKKETFGQWLGELVHELRGLVGGWLRNPTVESVGGLVFVVIFASPILAILISPWWLLVTLPGGVLLFLHGVWREDI